jgi:capsular exopolysaccharide synthesis family protein
VLTDKEAAFAVLRQRYGPENPAYSQADRELQQVRATLDATVLNAADSLRTQYESAKQSQQLSEKMLEEQEKVALDLNNKAIDYDALTREVVSDRALFDAVVNRIKEMAVSKRFNEINLRVVDPPRLGEPPKLMKRLLFVALGVFGGGALGLGSVIGRYVARPTFQSFDQAASVLGIPALGAIPRMQGLRSDAMRIPCIRDPRSLAAEAIRFLVACTGAEPGSGEKSSLLFCGPARDDGATTCAAAYAIALAQIGVRTLLVDSNLRAPKIGRLFSIPKETSGFADCLGNPSALDTAVVGTNVKNLFVLAAGNVPADVSMLFSSAGLGDVITRAVEAYGRVVIDSAAVTIASETLSLARHASAACIVLRAGRTSIRGALRACQLLEQTGRAPMGFILCDVPRRSMV